MLWKLTGLDINIYGKSAISLRIHYSENLYLVVLPVEVQAADVLNIVMRIVQGKHSGEILSSINLSCR